MRRSTVQRWCETHVLFLDEVRCNQTLTYAKPPPPHPPSSPSNSCNHGQLADAHHPQPVCYCHWRVSRTLQLRLALRPQTRTPSCLIVFCLCIFSAAHVLTMHLIVFCSVLTRCPCFPLSFLAAWMASVDGCVAGVRCSPPADPKATLDGGTGNGAALPCEPASGRTQPHH